MVDSTLVLWGQSIAYTLYCLIIILLVAWFTFRVTRGEKSKSCQTCAFLYFRWFPDSAGSISSYYYL